ncbi:hypothetical protein QO010_000109 [Caulobacter ginsengisoli]|uniref:Uncharacterized protein n=1 Tax=Caulobacter ginsengisoli TaxID=400775 RepID=A0ABU0ILV8_9CAUL|nr:hypothetical protein [Caulobacter ginsengisoli]MDQ0462361.1 hypothetical protein [Caulobacter ginsengisoli]
MNRPRLWTVDNVAPLMTIGVVLALDVFVVARTGLARWLNLPLDPNLLIGVAAFSVAVLLPNWVVVEMNMLEARVAKRARAVEDFRGLP